VALSSRRDGTAFNYVTLGARPDLNFGTSTDFTVSFWVRFSTWTFDPPFIGNKDWLSGNNPGYMIATGTDGRLQWNYGGAPGLRKDYDGPASTVSNGQWHHVAVTFLRAGEVLTYLDGVEVDVRDVTASLNNVDTPLGLATNIGQDGLGNYTDGNAVGVDDLAMDDLGIWRRVLTATEVRAIHQAGLAGQDLSIVVSNPELPTLRFPPQGQSVAAGDPVTFKAVPRGTSPFTFQWQRNGVDLPGATTAILSIPDAQAAQAGQYTVKITNAAGSLTSDPAELAVDTTQAPVISEQPLSQAAALGGTARFKVLARGVAPLSYQWRKDGADLSGQTGATLTLSRVKSADVGKYSVRIAAGNQLATLSGEAELTLIEDIRKDLVAHLTFDSDFKDSSGRGNHGAPEGNPTLVEGKIGGKALRFITRADGSEINYVTLGKPADLDFGYDADYSFSFWLRFSEWTRDPNLISNKSWANSGSLIGYALAVGSDGRFQWNFKEQVGERADYDSPPGVISDGVWHHIAVAFQRGGTATTWIDGQEVDARPLPASGTVIEPGLPLNVGQDGTGTYTENGAASIGDGTLDDLAIWRRAITGDEVATIYQKGVLFGANVQQQAITDGLVAHLPFDGDYQDRSGRLNHAAPVGQPTFGPGQVGTQALRYSTLTNGPTFNYATLGAKADLDFGADIDFSVSFWTRFSQWSGDPPFIGNKNWASGGNQGWVVATAGNARVQWNLGDGDAGGRTRADYDGPANMIGGGRWHHVVVTFDRQGNGLTYLDGVLTNTTTLVAGLDSIDTPAGLATNIGQDGTGGYTDNLKVGIVDGEIDDVGLWRRVLQAVEITQLYQQGLQGVNLLGQAPPPVLRVTGAPGSITLAWPESASGYQLEQSLTLGPSAAWSPVPNVTGSSTTRPTTDAAVYYRLRKP
jgi:hypothetical protein